MAVSVRGLAAHLLSAAILGLSACGGDATDAPSERDAQSVQDPAGQATCSRFREVSGDAFAEVLSETEVVSGLREVGSLAEDSTTPAIRQNGLRVGVEANANAAISGEPDPAQDALAEACNAAFSL